MRLLEAVPQFASTQLTAYPSLILLPSTHPFTSVYFLQLLYLAFSVTLGVTLCINSLVWFSSHTAGVE